MIRAEIFVNKSVQEYLLNNLESAMPDFFYSVMPLTHGRGGESRKLGTTVWPETNVTIIAYCEDDKEKIIKTVQLRKRMPAALQRQRKAPGKGVEISTAVFS